MSVPMIPDAWVLVSRSALRHNFEVVQRLSAPAQTIAVLKANAYGHGAGETAQIFQDAGADFFAVTTPGEAMELRDVGIAGRILVFLPPLPEQMEALAELDLDLTVCDTAGLDTIAAAARQHGRVVSVHLKVDTGMGRLGVLPANALLLARQIAETKEVRFAGIYTHFARALEQKEGATRRQFGLFQSVLAELEHAGIKPGLRHCANSAALVRFPEMRGDSVRPGTLLYGQYPSASVPRHLDLKETWRLQARVVAVRDVPTGSAIGYGSEYVTRRPTKIAVLPLGYADGFTVTPASAHSGWRGVKTLLREFAGQGPKLSVSLRGQCAPVIGRVAMQICTIDVTEIPGVAVGDVADIPARRITTSARLPRVYTERFEP